MKRNVRRTVLRRRADGLVEICRVNRTRWVVFGVAAGVLAVLPLALSLVVELPPVVFMVTPATLGLGVTILFSNLDDPRAYRPIHRGPGGRAAHGAEPKSGAMP